MDEQSGQKKSKTGLIAGIIIGALIILGVGGYFIFQAVVNTPKNSYLLSEKALIENHFELFEERFEDELEWYDYVQSNPIETSLNITAEANDPSLDQAGLSEIINSAEINLDAATDMEEETSTVALAADIAGVSIDGLDMFLTGDNLGATLPFIDEYLTLSDEDAPAFLHNMDPYTFPVETTIDYSVFFDDQMLSEEDREYIEDEYMSFIQDELPDEAFESTDEEVTIGEETINAERLSMTLSEEEIQTFLSDLFNKMAEDEELLDIIEAQVMASNIGMPESEVEQAASDVNESLSTAAEEVQNVEFPDGLSSVIWVDGDDIVQREFDLSAVAEGETIQISLNGTNDISDESYVMDYDAVLGDSMSEFTFSINADLNEVENGYEDTITLSTSESDTDIVLSSNKTSSDDVEESTFQLDIPFGYGDEQLSIFLETEATYENDRATGDYTIYVEDGQTISRDTAALNISQESVTVDSVELPELSNEVNLGQMSEAELNEYFNTTFSDSFEEWVEENLGEFAPASSPTPY